MRSAHAKGEARRRRVEIKDAIEGLMMAVVWRVTVEAEVDVAAVARCSRRRTRRRWM